MLGNFNDSRLNFKGLFLGLFVFLAVFGMIFACKAPVTPTVPGPERYTVTFHFDGKTKSETYTAGEELELLTEEEAGISADYEIEGWYLDSAFTEEAHGGTPVNSNLDIYGKLTKIDTSIEYTVKFVNDGGTALGEEQKVNAGGSVTVPGTPTPELEEHGGWKFSGWGLSSEGTDLLSVSDGKISIKASWAGDGNVITIYAVYIDPVSERPVTGIELSPGEDFELYVGETKNLAVLYTPEGANIGRDLSWTCTPEGIVKVESTADGEKVTALTEGSATITVKLSGNDSITDSVKVTVSRKTVTVTGVELKASGSTVSVGGSLNLTLTASYSDGSSRSITEGVTYAVSPVASGKVEGNVFTALASGSVTVTATYEGKTSQVVITVTVNEVSVSSKSGVMLQGFNWSSAKRGGNYTWESRSPYWDYWYKVMIGQGAVIGDTFAYVWCPPPSRTDTASSEGYGPTMLNDLDSCYGTEEELLQVIEAIKPAKAIADVVVNHRAGTASWGGFTNPDWGVVIGSNYHVICSDDEGFSNSNSDMYNCDKRGAPDTGATYEAYRDLDHTNPVVQQGIVDWMNDVLKPAGFVGWRYDYVKGYGGEYVGYYNAKTNPEFSVGEYWPEGDADWVSEIDTWLTETEASINGTQGMPSKAFDFVLKRNLNEAFGWYKNSTDQGSEDHKTLWDMSKLADANTLMRKNPSRAVTFVDNHDTGSSQLHWCLDPGDLGPAYAFILTHPGYPCVAWQHYFTYAESGSKVDPEQYIGGNTVPGTENTYRQHIDYLIDLRQRIGIEYDDVVDVVGKSNNYYAGKITGLNGEIVVVIGNGYTPSGEGYDGNNPIYAGTNFAIWEKGVNGTDSIGGGGTEPGETVTLSVNCDVGNGNAIFFTGSFTGADEWKTALRGTWNEGNVWTCTVPAGSFEWKCLKGSYVSVESVKIEGSELVWESGSNHSSTETEITPSF